MTNHKIQFVGSPCGEHGNYTFYKALKYVIDGNQKILALGDFFFLKFFPEQDIISIGEPQLIWEEKSSGEILISLRLYFLPENTPEGRGDEHGEHEVVSLSEKIILRADDVFRVMRPPSNISWDTGLPGIFSEAADPSTFYSPPVSHSIDIHEIMKEKKLIGDSVDSNSTHVIVLAYDAYCRMRALLKRLEGVTQELMRSKIVRALGGFLVPSKKTRLLYCKDVFEYPELETHELLCNHLAPKLQGRPRKKKRKVSESDSSDSSDDQRQWLKPGIVSKPNSLISAKNKSVLNRVSHNTQLSNLSSSLSQQKMLELSREANFNQKLTDFMRKRNTPIIRLPMLEGKPLSLYRLYTRVQYYGGYSSVCEKNRWITLYEEFRPNKGVYPENAGTQLRKTYFRNLLPFERYRLQEQREKYKSKENKPQQPKLVNKQKTFPQIGFKDEGGEPSISIVQIPKAPPIKENFNSSFTSDLTKSPEVTITPIPKSPGGPPSASITPLQFSDISLSQVLGNSLGALQNLAKYTDSCDKISIEPISKKQKSERVNGSAKKEHWERKEVNTDLLRQLNLLDSNNSKLLLPAHQSNKTINALASLLPHTSIFPAPVPEAHQHSKSESKPQLESIKPEPIFQTQSVYSQSKNIYSKPDSPVKETNHNRNRDSSPEIEILDLTTPPKNKSERIDLDLLDLSARKDITVSAVTRPTSSKSKPNQPNITIRATENSKHNSTPKTPNNSVQNNPLAQVLASQGLSPSSLALGMNNPALLPYLMSGVKPGGNSPPGGVPFLSPYMNMDPTSLAAYYSLLPHGFAGPNSSAGNAAMAAAQQQALAAQFAQIASMNLGGMPQEAANLGIYKNYLMQQGNLPPPHFLSGLMSPGSGSNNPPK